MLLTFPVQGVAQTTPEALYRIQGDRADHARGLALLHEYAAREGIQLRDAAVPSPAPAEPHSPAAALDVLARVETALVEARELSAELREGAALRVLLEAEQALEDALEVPGAHAFLAELHVQIGLCAALMGQRGLAETALTRALSLDPARRVEAAEAPPATLALARQIARGHDVLPVSENPLQLEAAGATAWLDGVRITGPTLAARAGLHLLVIEAPGHTRHATLLTLEAGRRPPLRVVLSPTRVEQARRAYVAEGGATEALTLSALRKAPVLTLELTDRRALLQHCSDRCRWLALAHGKLPRALEGDARAWLHARPLPPAVQKERPVWKRWPVWVSSAALVAAGVTALLVTRDPGERRERQLEIDPGTPPR